MPRRTVLEPLRLLRKQQVQRQIGQLVQQAARRKDAEAQERELHGELEREATVTEGVAADVSGWLMAGELRAHELSQADRWLLEARQRESEVRA